MFFTSDKTAELYAGERGGAKSPARGYGRDHMDLRAWTRNGAYRFTVAIPAGWYRSPAAAPFGATSSIRSRSSGVSARAAAATFSSRCARVVVPGIGTMSSPCARTHASASCDGFSPSRAGDLPDAVHEPEVPLEVLALEAGRAAAVVVRRRGPRAGGSGR